MPIRTAIWRVGPEPQPLAKSSLANEQVLEDMIVAAPQMLSDEWMLIGRQEDTGFGGRIDLLAIAPDGALVLIELKRDRTPREVVAQALDYGCWVEKLRAEDVDDIYRRFKPGRSLADDFHQRFDADLDEESLNESHQIIIVANAIDDSTERIVTYLSKRDVSINVLCFEVFTLGDGQLFSRAWLLDPVHTPSGVGGTSSGPNEPWNGEFYACFGAGNNRSWDEAVKYGFISAGGGPWHIRTLQLLDPGDRVWVNVPHTGYVGVGRVTGSVQPAKAFTVATPDGEVPVLDVVQHGAYFRPFVDDPEQCEYFVPIEWLHTVPIEQAVSEVGLFGNQNTVCKPKAARWRHTVERLKGKFSNWGKG